MRTGIVFGILALFTVISFVPPGRGQAMLSQQKDISIDVTINVDKVKEAIQVAGNTVSAVKKATDFQVDTPVSEITDNEQEHFYVALDQARKDPDADIRTLFHEIEWAEEKEDIKACQNLSPIIVDERTVDGVQLQTPDVGDWLAYCLARVTKEPKRCTQISEKIEPALKMLCDEEFL